MDSIEEFIVKWNENGAIIVIFENLQHGFNEVILIVISLSSLDFWLRFSIRWSINPQKKQSIRYLIRKWIELQNLLINKKKLIIII